MTTPTTSRNPFDLPELRYRLSRFVTLEDALSCTLVSTSWTHEFQSVIWFKIDLRVRSKFVNLPEETIAKYGHHIRVVDGVISQSQVSAIAHPSINKLRFLYVETTASTLQHRRAFEIVARNNTTLQSLYLFPESSHSNDDQSTSYVTAQAFIPSSSTASPMSPSPRTTSVLTTLEVSQLCLTHDDLITILEASPRLSKIRLSMCNIVGTPTRFFQHTGVTLLAWALKDIFPQRRTENPSLLSYFPNLTILHTWKGNLNYEIPTVRIKRELALYCPRLTQYKLEDYTGSITSEFLTDIASNVSRLTIHLDCLTPGTVTAILLHQKTIKKVAHFYHRGFDYDKEQVGPVSSNLQVTDEMILQIPRRCSQLQRLNFHRLEFDMDTVEKVEWVCKDLRKLRIRFKDLNTKETILRAIALWRAGCWRRRQENATGAKELAAAVVVEEKQLAADQSIEARVARHLLKFEHLEWVWLGYQMWTPV